MARGTLYFISKDKADMGQFSMDDIAHLAEHSEFEWAEDANTDSAREDIEVLRKKLNAAGLITEYRPDSTYMAVTTPEKERLQTCKEQLFEKRYGSFMEKARHMTSQDFTNRLSVMSLANILEDRYGDAVWLDMGTGAAFYSMDTFLRIMEPSATYYIQTSTVLMH